MKKIVFTVTNDLSYDQRMIRICRTLSENSMDVMLLGFEKDNSVPLLEESFKQKRLKLFFRRGKLFYLEYNIRLFVYLLRNPFDIACGIDLDTILPVYLACRIRQKTSVYDAHEYFTELPEVIGRKWVHRFWLLLEKWVVPLVRHRYTVGEGIARLFREKYNVKFDVIRNVPPKKSPEFIDKKEDYILYQGALNEGRGIEQLFKAMPHVNCKLYIAGEGDLSHSLRKKTRKLGLGDKVRFLGYVSPDELWKYTCSAKLGLNLLENRGLSYYYSLSNKFFDYIHAGIPQVCMNFPEYKHINDEFEVACMLPGLKPEFIANVINRLLEDDELYKKLSANCEEAASKFNWDIEKNKLLQLYQRIE